jgi:hypothetical protein
LEAKRFLVGEAIPLFSSGLSSSSFLHLVIIEKAEIASTSKSRWSRNDTRMGYTSW